VSTENGKARWSVERRLEFIDYRLYWSGRINRGDLIDYFEISMPQASADISQYLEGAEGNAEYDKTAKAYVATSHFKPKYFKPSAETYLSQLQMLASGFLTEDEAMVGKPPPFAVVPTLQRRQDPKILRSILDAIHTRSSVEVHYQSFSRPEPQWRRLSPHALASDGFRWHVRAWCHTRKDFRDFVIGRFLSARAPRPDDIDPTQDTGWTREVTFKIGPHPEMTDGARKMTEISYGMGDGVVEVTTRACMAPYLKRRYGLNKDPRKVSPKEQQIVLLNCDEVERAMRDAGVTFTAEASVAE
jgi:hypothetical protein